MATSINVGIPAWVDDPTMDAQTPWRTFEIGTKCHNAGTAAANQVPGGVFPGNGAMAVTAPGGLTVNVAAGYCVCPNSSSALQGGYAFGLMTSQVLTIATADPVNPRIDVVAAWVNDLGDDASAAYVGVITGTASSSPSPLTGSALPANSIVLAQVYVQAGSSSVTSSNITDERYYVVAPGGILPIQSPAFAPAVPASQFMYDLSSGQLCQGTGTAGSVQLPSLLPWTPQIAISTSSTLAGSGGALVTVLSVTVAVNGSTDLEIYIKWAGIQGNAGYITMGVYIDGTLADSLDVTSLNGSIPSSGGSAHFYTSSSQGNTPTSGTHTISYRFQAGGGGTSNTDGIVASPSSVTMLRVAPVSV